jgi:hypothetical protein
MINYPSVLNAIRPGAQWTLDGDEYAGLTWLDESPKPTQKTLDDAWPQIQYDLVYAEVERKRQDAYQRDTDPLFFKWQRGTATEQEWLDAVQAVKDAHPYPEPPDA